MTDMDMDLFSSFLFDEDDDASKEGSDYESDQEDGDTMVASVDGSLTASNQVVEQVRSAPLEAMANNYDTEMSSLSSDAQPNADSAGSSSPSPDSSETGDYDDCEEEEEFDMVFLDSKRRLLKRVADIMYSDEVYDASIAKHNPDRCTTPPIWAEAKEVIETLTGKPMGSSRQATFATNTNNTEHHNKKARIDFSTVSRIDSKAYCQDAMTAPSSKLGPTTSNGGQMNKQPAAGPTPYSDTKWMIKALQKLSENVDSAATSSLTSADTTCPQESWDIKLDPLLGIVSSGESSENSKPQRQGSTTMTEALAITDLPQLVCQASPPFLAVYANKAFFSYSRLASKDVICKPVEEIITVNKAVEKFIANANNDESPTENNCQVQVKPVVNHVGVMSHVLVQVHQECTALGDALLFGNNASVPHNKHANILVGAVG